MPLRRPVKIPLEYYTMREPEIVMQGEEILISPCATDALAAERLIVFNLNGDIRKRGDV